MLAEFGIIAPKGRHAIQKAIPEALENAENQLPDLARTILSDSDEHLLNINQRIADQERYFDMLVSRSHNAQKNHESGWHWPYNRHRCHSKHR